MVQIFRVLLHLHLLYWTLTWTPLRYSVVAYCYRELADLKLKSWTLHKLQHVIDDEGVECINLYPCLWSWVVAVSSACQFSLIYTSSIALVNSPTVAANRELGHFSNFPEDCLTLTNTFSTRSTLLPGHLFSLVLQLVKCRNSSAALVFLDKRSLLLQVARLGKGIFPSPCYCVADGGGRVKSLALTPSGTAQPGLL